MSDSSTDAVRKSLEVVAEISGCPVEDLKQEQQLVGDLGIDSPKALQMLIQLEEVLDIEISDEEAARMDTVGDIVSFVTSVPAR